MVAADVGAVGLGVEPERRGRRRPGAGAAAAARAAEGEGAADAKRGAAVFGRFIRGDVAIPVVGAANATAVAGGGVFLGTRIPLAVALELTLTGVYIDAGRALALGLVNLVTAPGEVLDAAFALAGRIARNGTLALQATKQLVRTASTDAARAWQLQAEWQRRALAVRTRRRAPPRSSSAATRSGRDAEGSAPARAPLLRAAWAQRCR